MRRRPASGALRAAPAADASPRAREGPGNAMMKNVLKWLTIILINLAVLAGILVGVEFGFRFFYNATPAKADQYAIWLSFQPYVMTSNPQTHYSKWINEFQKSLNETDVSTNNYGYTDRDNFDLTKPYRKAANEKVVLFTGGSTAWGVGASHNENIIHEKMAGILNEVQTGTKYTVVNLAMGGWIAQQEDIAIDIWGRLYDPDWIVAMDGANDTQVECPQGQGTGNPVFFQLIKSYVDGYLGTQIKPEFYRGYWENELLLYSAAYGALSGKQYIPRLQRFDTSLTDTRLQVITPTPTPLSEVRNMVDFYALAEKSMLDRYQNAKYILSSQPSAQDFGFLNGEFYRDGETYTIDPKARERFSAELQEWLNSVKPEQRVCSAESTSVGVATRYIGAMGSIKLAEMVEEYRAAQRRDVEYFNTGLLFPKDPKERQAYFLDNYHLNDDGLETVARYYAYRILKRDFPDKDWSALKPSLRWFQSP
jgi:hypothetical protein